MRTGTARLFLALCPDEPTQRALARCRDAWSWSAEAAPVATARLHLTLHFLGAVADRRVPELVDGLSVPFTPFELRLDRAERWPNGIAALTSSEAPHELFELHAALGERLRALNIPTETRRYRPHLTLARRAGRSTAPAIAMAVQWPVWSYALVESRAGDYVVLRGHGLARPARSA